MKIIEAQRNMEKDKKNMAVKLTQMEAYILLKNLEQQLKK